MAFATKYRFAIYSYELATYWKVDLQTDGYGGSVLSQEVGADSFQIRQEGIGGTKFSSSSGHCIKGTSASLSILIENSTDYHNFIALATIGEREWKMLIYKGTAPGNEVLYHSMFIQPDVFQFPYEDYPYFINITATDEIGRLQGIKLYSSGTTRYTTRQSVIYFIFEILNKLGIQRQIREVCNIYSSEMDATAGDSPLVQSTVDPTVYLINQGRDNEDVMDCATVLNHLLKPFCLILTLGNDDRWFLRRPTELAADSHTERILSNATTVASYATVSNHILTTNALTSAAIVTWVQSPMAMVDWRWKRVVVKFLLGLADSFVIDGDFAPAAWTDINTLTNWSKVFRFNGQGFTLSYERIELSDVVECQEGHYISASVSESKIYIFTVDVTNNELDVLDAADGEASPFNPGDRVYIRVSAGGTLPNGLHENQPFFIKEVFDAPVDADTNDDVHRMTIANQLGGSKLQFTNGGSGTFYIGKAKTADIKYAVQLNGYQTNLWSDDAIDAKAAIKSTLVDVVAGGGNTFEVSFWWKILFDNQEPVQASESEAYYQLVVEGASQTYYYNKVSNSWGTAVVVNVLKDGLKIYGWIKEVVQPAAFPVNGNFYITLWTPSSSSNTDTLGVQYALLASQFLIGGDDNVEYIEKVAEVGSDYAYEPETIEVLSGDAPSSIYRGHIGFGAGLATAWYRKGTTESKALLDLMLQAYMNNYGRTSLKVSGALMADYDAEQLIEDSNLNYDREGATVTPRFMLSGGTYNVEAGIWQGEWLEINE